MANPLPIAVRLAAVSCLCLCPPLWAADWPKIAMPPGVSAFAVGEQFTSNGLPMRVQGFVAKDQSAQSLADWFRRSLGQPLVENKLGNKLILGRAEGGYYLSVQIEPIGPDGRTGSKGLLAVSDLATLSRNRDADAASAQRWLERWPSGTRLLSRMTSEDNGRASLHVVLSNGHSESLNRDALVAVMKVDGLALVRESGTPANQPDRVPTALQDARALFFKGQNKEGIATIARDGQGQTNVVLNTTTDLETFRP
jgi:hypothetical protein